MSDKLHVTEVTDFAVVSFNKHSLLRFNQRIEWLIEELGNRQWDLVVSTETWRVDRVEAWHTKHGHTWLGTGGTEHERGVGFLLGSQWNI